jgi:flagellar hook-basal body protein
MAEGETQGGQYVGHSYLQLVSQDGYAEGTLIELSISQAGVIEGNFTNGQTGVDLARISMARFSNPEGLSSVGGNYYTQSANSGPLTIGFAGEGTIGTLQSGALEASNVDLGLELTNMIIAQRSYDANSRTSGREQRELADSHRDETLKVTGTGPGLDPQSSESIERKHESVKKNNILRI